jgi:hypothetical protein
MRRREFIGLAGASVTWSFAATAQEPGRTYRLGLISPLPCEATPSKAPMTVVFQDGLRHLGFVKDQNLTFACRDVGPKSSPPSTCPAMTWMTRRRRLPGASGALSKSKPLRCVVLG